MTKYRVVFHATIECEFDSDDLVPDPDYEDMEEQAFDYAHELAWNNLMNLKHLEQFYDFEVEDVRMIADEQNKT